MSAPDPLPDPDTLADPASDRAAPAVAAPDPWQPLPPRARPLFVLGGLLLAIPFAIAPAVLAEVFDLATPWLAGPVGGLIGAALGAWLGIKRHRHTWWLLDGDGFSLRRGRLWSSETRVPETRVQHLDLRRGPLQRRYRLATLVIHTAGTRHSAVTVSCLDEGDAERLRDRLARQIDHDGD